MWWNVIPLGHHLLLMQRYRVSIVANKMIWLGFTTLLQSSSSIHHLIVHVVQMIDFVVVVLRESYLTLTLTNAILLAMLLSVLLVI